MIVPGLPTGAASSGYALSISASENDVDVFTRIGSPAGQVNAVIAVLPGVVVGSTNVANAAMTFSGFAVGSTFTLINQGRIGGKGGDGGRGGNSLVTLNTVGAGGGGGAGSTVGIGGIATSPATAGDNGTATAGGSHGTSSVSGGSEPPLAATEGENGGDAISTGGFSITIDNGSGEIWGGGGGGVGGFEPNPTLADGSDGGDIASDCEHIGLLASGFAGYAIRGTGATFTSGSGDPNVKGTVDP